MKPAVVLAGAVLLLLVGAGAVAVLREDDNASGSGFTFRGEFYAMSGAEVREDRLGRVLERAVPLHDTASDVRAISGVDPEVAVAALVRDVGGTASEGGRAWLLMSPDPDLAADPWSSELAAVVSEAQPLP